MVTKIVNYQKPYTGKVDGKLHPSITYYLDVEMATPDIQSKTVSIAIMPKFDKSQRDWQRLDMIATVKTIGEPADMEKFAKAQ